MQEDAKPGNNARPYTGEPWATLSIIIADIYLI